MIMTPSCCLTEERESSFPLHTMVMKSPQQFLLRDHVISNNAALNDHVIRPSSSKSTTAHSVHTKGVVSIHELIQVQTTIACHEMSQQEMDAVWYSRKEFQKITQSCCKQIIKLNRGEIVKGKKHCARGLESHTHIRSLAKSMNRN